MTDGAGPEAGQTGITIKAKFSPFLPFALLLQTVACSRRRHPGRDKVGRDLRFGNTREAFRQLPREVLLHSTNGEFYDRTLEPEAVVAAHCRREPECWSVEVDRAGLAVVLVEDDGSVVVNDGRERSIESICSTMAGQPSIPPRSLFAVSKPAATATLGGTTGVESGAASSSVTTSPAVTSRWFRRHHDLSMTSAPTAMRGRYQEPKCRPCPQRRGGARTPPRSRRPAAAETATAPGGSRLGGRRRTRWCRRWSPWRVAEARAARDR